MAIVNGTAVGGSAAFTKSGGPAFDTTGLLFRGWFCWDGTGAGALFNVSGNNYDEINSSITAAGVLRFWTSVDGNTNVPSFTVVAGNVYGFAITVSTSNVLLVYVWSEGGTPSAARLTLTSGITSPVRDIEIARWEGGDYFNKGWIEYWGIAQVVLTLAQLQTQATQKNPVATEWATWHLEGASTADASGNARTLTAVGAPTTATDGVDFGGGTTVECSAMGWIAFVGVAQSAPSETLAAVALGGSLGAAAAVPSVTDSALGASGLVAAGGSASTATNAAASTSGVEAVAQATPSSTSAALGSSGIWGQSIAAPTVLLSAQSELASFGATQVSSSAQSVAKSSSGLLSAVAGSTEVAGQFYGFGISGILGTAAAATSTIASAASTSVVFGVTASQAQVLAAVKGLSGELATAEGTTENIAQCYGFGLCGVLGVARAESSVAASAVGGALAFSSVVVAPTTEAHSLGVASFIGIALIGETLQSVRFAIESRHALRLQVQTVKSIRFSIQTRKA